MSYCYNAVLSIVVHRLAAFHWVFTTVMMVGQYMACFCVRFLMHSCSTHFHTRNIIIFLCANFYFLLFLMSLWLSVSLMPRKVSHKWSHTEIVTHENKSKSRWFPFFSLQIVSFARTIKNHECSREKWRRKWNFLLYEHKELNFWHTQKDGNFTISLCST